MAIVMQAAAPPQVRSRPKIMKTIAPTDIISLLIRFSILYEDVRIGPF